MCVVLAFLESHAHGYSNDVQQWTAGPSNVADSRVIAAADEACGAGF
jgi:hypothetical protein